MDSKRVEGPRDKADNRRIPTRWIVFGQVLDVTRTSLIRCDILEKAYTGCLSRLSQEQVSELKSVGMDLRQQVREVSLQKQYHVAMLESLRATRTSKPELATEDNYRAVKTAPIITARKV